MLPIRISDHAAEQALERGATADEIIHAIQKGEWEPAKKDRLQSRANFQFNQEWNGKLYSVKQVKPVFKELEIEIIVVTVYTYYF